METYTIESARDNFSLLLHKAAHGTEIMITEEEKPLAKIVSASTLSAREQIRAIRGIAPGIDTRVERDEDRV